MKICIISDLHCRYQRDVNSPSDTLLFSNMPRIPISQNPVVSMLKIIDDDTIKTDVLLCLGDLGDRADEQGIISAWQSVDEIQRKLEVQHKLGIPGNHDINSRSQDGRDAFAFIKAFHEGFPTNDESLNASFWSDGFCIQILDSTLYLLLNTVYDHSDAIKAAESNISVATIEKIKGKLQKLVTSEIKFKICMLHHHPIKHSNIQNYKDSDSLERGDVLLALLNEFHFNIVLHGHKHQPRINEENGLPVFAVGSFSSFANLQGTGLHNMFHVVELFEDSRGGIIHSWEYNVRNGWSKNLNKHFPPQIGFGASMDLDETAKKIQDIVATDSKPKFYSEILEEIPDLKFLIPDKLTQLGSIMKNKYRLAVSPEFPLIPNIVTLM